MEAPFVQLPSGKCWWPLLGAVVAKGIRGGWLNGAEEFLLLGFSGKGGEQQKCHQELGWEGVLGDSELSKGFGAGQGQGQVCGEGGLLSRSHTPFSQPVLRGAVAGVKLPEAVKAGISTKREKVTGGKARLAPPPSQGPAGMCLLWGGSGAGVGFVT